MSTGSKILESLSENVALSSAVSFDENSIIFFCSSFPAMSGKIIAGTHLKIGICLSDGGIVKYGQRSWRWKQGDILITAPNENNTFYSPDVNMLGIAIDTEKFCHLCQPENQNYRSNVVTDELIKSVALALWQSVEHYGECSNFIREGISVILKRIDEISAASYTTQRGLCLSHRQISSLETYIKAHMEHDIKTEALADLLGMGVRQFSCILKSSTGLTPYKYVLKHKMSEAKHHLSQGFCVTSVAGKIGYTNPSKFSAAFSRVVGCTPSHWKNRQKNKCQKHQHFSR